MLMSSRQPVFLSSTWIKLQNPHTQSSVCHVSWQPARRSIAAQLFFFFFLSVYYTTMAERSYTAGVLRAWSWTQAGSGGRWLDDEARLSTPPLYEKKLTDGSKFYPFSVTMYSSGQVQLVHNETESLTSVVSSETIMCYRRGISELQPTGIRTVKLNNDM